MIPKKKQNERAHMEWKKAIGLSLKGTATRIINHDCGSGIKRTIIRYKDGTGYSMASKDGKVDFFLSRPAMDFELNGFNDWKPSE